MIASHPAPARPATDQRPHVYTPPQLIDEVAGVYRQWRWDGHQIALWLGSATPALVARFIQNRPARGTHPRSDIHLVTSGINLPDAPTRTAWGEALADQQEELACVVVVVEGGGFWSSAMRGVVTGITMLAPQMQSLLVAGSIADVVAAQACELYGLGDGDDGLDMTTLYSMSGSLADEKMAQYETAFPDCDGGWQTYLRQSMPGLGNAATDEHGMPMKNWWPFLFY